MNYWWVNQNQTYLQERAGGYLWSPKLRSDGVRNPFYEYMRKVCPGDLIFSFSDTVIKAISVAQSTAYGFPKPEEFGETGANWSNLGWRVDVEYHELKNQIRPAEAMDRLARYLPTRYSPLQQSGRGNQGVYLTSVPDPMANALISLIGAEARELEQALLQVRYHDVDDELPGRTEGILLMEERQVDDLKQNLSLSDTEKRSIILARRGQGKFRDNVARIETKCRVTEVERPEHLIASHIKPWRYCESAEERLVGSNGLLLTPSVDHLFDLGYISFDDSGELLVSPVADALSLERMGIRRQEFHARSFNSDQRFFLEYHRSDVFLKPDLS